MVPAACAIRSLLALKLFGNARHRHVMSYVLDEGLAVFAGLNAIPELPVPHRVQLPHPAQLQLTLMASSLYRLLAVRVANGYEAAKCRHLFMDLIDATADILITASQVVVKFQKRAHNPLLIAAGFDKTDVVIPWLGGKRLRLVFG